MLNSLLGFISNITPKWMIQFTADTYLSTKPMFIQYKPSHHKVKGISFEYIRSVIEPADILLRRYNGYLNTQFTKGFYGHAGGYIGKEDHNLNGRIIKDVPTVIHALGEGVVKETLADFCRTDSVCVIRLGLNDEEKSYFIHKLNTLLGAKYDYKFKSGNNNYYCTELIDMAVANKFKHLYSDYLGKRVLLPDGIYYDYKSNIVYEEKN